VKSPTDPNHLLSSDLDIQVGILLGMWHSSLNRCYPILRCVTSDFQNLRWNSKISGVVGFWGKLEIITILRSSQWWIWHFAPKNKTAPTKQQLLGIGHDFGERFPMFRSSCGFPIPDDCKDVKPPGESYHCPLPWIMDWWILCHVLAGTNGGWRALRFFMAGHPWHILEWMCFSDEVLYHMPAPEGSQDLKIFFTPPMCSFRLTLTKKWINDHKGSWSLLLGMTMWSSPLFFPQEGLYSELFLGDLFRG